MRAGFALHLEFGDFFLQPGDLGLLRLHLPMPRKGMLRIFGYFTYPFAQYVLVYIKVLCRLND